MTNFHILLIRNDKRLENVPGRPIISSCGAPTEKVSEFLDFHLKNIMQNGGSLLKILMILKAKSKTSIFLMMLC